VPGLESRNVSIIDTQGNSLTETFQDETALLSSTQWEYKMKVDRYLANEAKRMLDGAFGAGKSLVTVNAELNWDSIERQSKTYSPEGSTLLSEERRTETTPTPDGIGEMEQSTTNYETGQTTENFVKNRGDIDRLTVSVFVDKRDSTVVDSEGETQVVKVPWAVAQLTSIRSITENAVGFNTARGDRVEVVEAEFGAGPVVEAARGLVMGASLVELVQTVFLGIAIIAAILVFYFIIKAIVSSLEPGKITIQAGEEFEKHKVEIEEEEAVAESDRDILIRKILKTTIENPEIAAKTIKSIFKE